MMAVLHTVWSVFAPRTERSLPVARAVISFYSGQQTLRMNKCQYPARSCLSKQVAPAKQPAWPVLALVGTSANSPEGTQTPRVFHGYRRPLPPRLKLHLTESQSLRDCCPTISPCDFDHPQLFPRFLQYSTCP